jgi:hypothetical protein
MGRVVRSMARKKAVTVPRTSKRGWSAAGHVSKSASGNVALQRWLSRGAWGSTVIVTMSTRGGEHGTSDASAWSAVHVGRVV